ncbi:hypothetical protein WA538_002694 [Blastocystis sp. DL]
MSLPLDQDEEDALIVDPILDSISDDSIDPLPLHTIDDNGVIYCSCVSSSKTPRPNLEESVANGVENESSFSLDTPSKTGFLKELRSRWRFFRVFFSL